MYFNHAEVGLAAGGIKRDQRLSNSMALCSVLVCDMEIL